MTNTRFNRIWEQLREKGQVYFTDHNNNLSLSLVPSRYGTEVSLRIENAVWQTVLVHHDKSRFMELLVD